MITLLVSAQELLGDNLEVSGLPYRHLFRARRLASGERLRLTDGRGQARWARVVRVGGQTARLRLGDAAPDNEPALRVTLLVAAPKPQRAAWLVEKGTEVGVAAVRLVRSRRAQRQYGPGTLERLRRVAAAAVEQCHRSVVPEITGRHDWEELEELLESIDERWMLDPEGKEHLVARGVSAALLVGPEGGWGDDERQELLARGCRAADLGARTLRVETAAVVGCARLLLGHGNGRPGL